LPASRLPAGQAGTSEALSCDQACGWARAEKTRSGSKERAMRGMVKQSSPFRAEKKPD
jgi:hypothetical protein